LYYALGAIKNVGFDAVSQLVEERKKKGEFKSISDFINRVDPKNINKLQLEGLVKAGAFDSIFPNRKVLFENIPNLIQNSKNSFENKINKQSSLFTEDVHKISFLDNESNNKSFWTNDVLLSKEFESVGFYISNHPLEDYETILKQYDVKTYKDFERSKVNESFIAGTIMSIKEKKTAKGTSFAIIKLSDLSRLFEIFLFSEVLELNRPNLKQGKSFLLTVIKDKENSENRFRRINVRKIVNLDDVVKKNYNNVHIELKTIESLQQLYEKIKEKGESKIKISIEKEDKNYLFELKEKRKFDYETLKNLNKEHYIKKIRL